MRWKGERSGDEVKGRGKMWTKDRVEGREGRERGVRERWLKYACGIGDSPEPASKELFNV